MTAAAAWKPNRTVYRVVTPRLVLRCWSPSDAPGLQDAIQTSLPELRRWLVFVQSEPEPLEAKVSRLRVWRAAFDRDEFFQFGIFPADQSAVWGGAAILPRTGPGGVELSYWLRTSCQGTGVASEAAAALTQVAIRAYQLERVEIHCDPVNTASAAVPRRLGFRHEATLSRRLPWIDGTKRDRMIWTIWAEELNAAAAGRVPVQAFDALGEPVPMGASAGQPPSE